jgi:hypothetical protein
MEILLMAIKYRIYREGVLHAGAAGATQSTADIDAPPFNITGQTGGTSADWTVRAYDTVSALESDDSIALNVTQASAPSNDFTESFTTTPSANPAMTGGESGICGLGSSAVWETGGSGGRTDGNSVFVTADPLGLDVSLVRFDLPAHNGGTITYWVYDGFGSVGSTIKCQQDGATRPPTPNDTVTGSWTQKSSTLLADAGGSIINFRATNESFQAAVVIDDIVFTEA